jgi:DNA invertase Pin-like site-specific DNA recombinase
MAEVRCGIYARVSTTGTQSPEMQLRELIEYCHRRGWQITGEYVDAGLSGAKDSRPELNRLMSDAKQRRLDAVLVWKLDRFGRSLRHLVNSLAELEALGIAFVSLRDNVDLTTPAGRLQFHIIAAMAEFERALIQERVRSGLRNAKAKGVRLGRPRIALDLSTVVALQGQGYSVRAIARQLGVAVGTVHKTLRESRGAHIANKDTSATGSSVQH